ncbi:GcrA cell cycle regulator [Devosia enhydra]|uniref:GcrA cell cycle regulator n=1 Tax=Devosia enhydra TaxID=665118 RepID=A0A1K2I0X7_9HYPH|nr:GcrA family cell cycle regulator [Devosia enhydra]SFZ85977.1 GcrA cell cycle regulator [Devosia enhydra]
MRHARPHMMPYFGPRRSIGAQLLRRIDRLEGEVMRLRAALANPAEPAMTEQASEDRGVRPSKKATRSASAKRPGWTSAKLAEARKRFGQAMIGVPAELNVPANELLTYAINGSVPPIGRDAGFADTALPAPVTAPVALPAPELVEAAYVDVDIDELREPVIDLPAMALKGGRAPTEVPQEDAQPQPSGAGKPGDGGQKQGIALPVGRVGTGRPRDQKRGEQIRTLAAQGRHVGEIAHEAGVTNETIQKLARKYDISVLPMPRGWKPGDAPAPKPEPSDLTDPGTAKAADEPVWTEERIEQLREMARDGRSSTEMAEAFGVTRNSVLGKCNRLKIRLHPKQSTAHRSPTAKAEPVPAELSAPIPPAVKVPAPVAAARANVPAPRRKVVAAPVKKQWVRLRHPDGRWLRMDGMDWVTDKAGSYFAPEAKLEAALKAFPLAAECKPVFEPAWSPRDESFARIFK